MNGDLGEDAQVIATQLQAQIATITSEIANVYMGGNSPTDHAMELAARELNANWSMPQLKAATDLARRNLGLRLQSMSDTPVLGIGAAGQWKGTGEEEEPSSTPVIPVGPNEPVDYVWSNGRLVKVKKGPR